MQLPWTTGGWEIVQYVLPPLFFFVSEQVSDLSFFSGVSWSFYLRRPWCLVGATKEFERSYSSFVWFKVREFPRDFRRPPLALAWRPFTVVTTPMIVDTAWFLNSSMCVPASTFIKEL